MTACESDPRLANPTGYCEDYAKKDGAEDRESVIAACERGVEISKTLTNSTEIAAKCKEGRYDPEKVPEISGTDENALIEYSVAASRFSDLLMACYYGGNVILDLVTGLPIESDPAFSCVVTVGGGEIGDCQ